MPFIPPKLSHSILATNRFTVELSGASGVNGGTGDGNVEDARAGSTSSWQHAHLSKSKGPPFFGCRYGKAWRNIVSVRRSQ